MNGPCDMIDIMGINKTAECGCLLRQLAPDPDPPSMPFSPTDDNVGKL